MMQFTDEISARKFGFDSEKTVHGFKDQPTRFGRIARIDVAHAFDAAFFEKMKMWWEWEDTCAPLFISGPTGCGKTSGVMQFLARLNAPAITLTCRARMDKNDLIGNFTVADGGGFSWQDGPASLAWRHGLTLVINEFTLAPAEVWVSANDILEGDAIVNERTGEVLKRHANTRVIITDNTAPASESSFYLARNGQDAGVVDRCWHIRMDYLESEKEVAMLVEKFTRFAAHFGKAFGAFEKKAIDAAVRFARKSREENDAVCIHPISSRVLERFLGIYFEMRENAKSHAKATDLVEAALSLALTAGLGTSEKDYLQQLAHFEFAKIL